MQLPVSLQPISTCRGPARATIIRVRVVTTSGRSIQLIFLRSIKKTNTHANIFEISGSTNPQRDQLGGRPSRPRFRFTEIVIGSHLFSRIKSRDSRAKLIDTCTRTPARPLPPMGKFLGLTDRLILPFGCIEAPKKRRKKGEGEKYYVTNGKWPPTPLPFFSSLLQGRDLDGESYRDDRLIWLCGGDWNLGHGGVLRWKSSTLGFSTGRRVRALINRSRVWCVPDVQRDLCRYRGDIDEFDAFLFYLRDTCDTCTEKN